MRLLSSSLTLIATTLLSTSSFAAPTATTAKNIGDTPSKSNDFSSTAPPTSQLPFPISVYSQAAGLAQQTYCNNSKAGLTIGDAKLLWTYGDGDAQQRVNIYNSSSLGLSVAWEGTNTSSVHSIAYDVEFVPVPGDAVLDLPFGSLVDAGFQGAFLSSWKQVKEQLTARGAGNSSTSNKVTIIGHSLGASQASLGALAVEHAFGSGSVSRAVLYGLPRVGNKVYADHVDKVFAPTEEKRRWSYVVSGKDFVPHVPPRLIGYQHPAGQVWINPANTTSWMYYPGQENVKGANTVLAPPLSFE